MKGLNQFVAFNWDKFAEGKTFVATGISEYKDFETKQHLGTKVDAVIAEDRTIYQCKDGQMFSNRFEKITLKVVKDVNVPMDAQIIPKGVTATVYGDYRNQLSVKCEDIEIVAATAKEKN